MGIIEKFFPAKAAITSSTIRAEIDRANGEITAHRAKIITAESTIATLEDDAHVRVIENNAALGRAIARLEARIAHLTEELPAVLAAEDAARKAEADAALLKRAAAARKSNTIEAKKLLEQYGSAALAVVDVLTKLKAIDAEREAVNKALKLNPICEGVEDYNTTHRSTPGTDATERREQVPHWIYRDAPPHPGEVHPGETESAVRCTLDSNGKPLHPAGVRYGRGGNILTPTLERREAIVGRTHARPRSYAAALDDLRMPPAFTGSYIWPRS